MFDFFPIPGRTSSHERKLAAWALFVGERSRGDGLRDRVARSHRGMLPDFDPASAVPDPACLPLFTRILDAVSGRDRYVAMPQDAAAMLSGSLDQPVGNANVVAYIGGAESSAAGDRLPAGTASSPLKSRAA